MRTVLRGRWALLVLTGVLLQTLPEETGGAESARSRGTASLTNYRRCQALNDDGDQERARVTTQWKEASKHCAGSSPSAIVLCVENTATNKLLGGFEGGKGWGETEKGLIHHLDPGSGQVGTQPLRGGTVLCVGDELMTWADISVTLQGISRGKREGEPSQQRVAIPGRLKRLTEHSKLVIELDSRSPLRLAYGGLEYFHQEGYPPEGVRLGTLQSPFVVRPQKSFVVMNVSNECGGERSVEVAGEENPMAHLATIERWDGENYQSVAEVRGKQLVRWQGSEQVQGPMPEESTEGEAQKIRQAQGELKAMSPRSPVNERVLPTLLPELKPISLAFLVEPEQAQVWIDGLPVAVRRGRFEGLGQVNVALESGTHQVRMEARGYEVLQETMALSADTRPSTPTFRLRLRERPITVAAADSQTTLLPGSKEVITWLSIPPTGPDGFMMGSPDKEGADDEHPRHKVTVPAFEMSKTEVTVAQYRACVQAGKCTEPNGKDKNGYCNWGYPDRDNHPINCVDWEQARAFAAWAGARLPSEAEWEYAARGTEGRKYPWGNSPEPSCDVAVYDPSSLGGASKWGCGKGSTWPTCSKAKGNTPTGLCDMGGNVSEWVEDCYGHNYTDAPTDGSVRTECSAAFRVVRGGSWLNFDVNLSAAGRGHWTPGYRDFYVGFRLLRLSARAGSP